MSDQNFNPTETYYEVLKLDRSATTSEIVAAYQAAKAAFSKDSIATYSLFSNEEIQEILTKLEEAYLTLSNLERKREYDRWLDGGAEIKRPGSSTPSSAPVRAAATDQLKETPMNNEVQAFTDEVEATPAAATAVAVNGDNLRELREKRGLSVDDVARITKIPSKFLKAIESHDLKSLPARVYIQGFIKNLCSLYKLDPQATAKSYLEHIDRLGSQQGN